MREWLEKNLETIPAKNAAVLVAKLNSGRALSRAELAWLDDYSKGAAGAAAEPGPAQPQPAHAPAQTSYDSIAAAAAGLGVEKQLLKKAKRDGAPGFRGSRVYPAELLPWLEARKTTPTAGDGHKSKESLEAEFLQVRIERQQFAAAIERREYITVQEAQRWTSEMVNEFRKVIEGVPSTLAPDIVGCGSIAEAELRIRAALDAALRMLHEGPWGTPP